MKIPAFLVSGKKENRIWRRFILLLPRLPESQVHDVKAVLAGFDSLSIRAPGQGEHSGGLYGSGHADYHVIAKDEFQAVVG